MLVSPPAWLLEAVSKPTRPAPVLGCRPVRVPGAYGRRALESECQRVADAPEGTRNGVLNSAAFNLGQLVAGRVLAVDDVIDALLVAAQRAGLSVSEARRTIASGLDAGAEQPRGIEA